MTIYTQIALTLIVGFIALRFIIGGLIEDEVSLSENVEALLGLYTIIMFGSIITAAVNYIWF